MTATIRPEVTSVNEATLFVAFELSAKEWKLAMTSGWGVAPWLRTVPSGDLGAVERAIRQGKSRFSLPASAIVVSCYEAGRDGFWIHRALTTLGVRNRVVDSASIEVDRRARHAKTDRIDALKLVRMLVRVCCGERDVWREVRVPTIADEAARHVSREREALTQERTRVINQVRGWLATWGCRLPKRCAGEWWTTMRDWAGAPLYPQVQARLARAWQRLAGLEAQLAEISDQQQAAAKAAPDTSALARLVRRRPPRCCSMKDSSGGNFGTVARSAGCSDLRRRRTKVAIGCRSRASVGPGMRGCKRSPCSSPGAGSAGNRIVRSRSGIARALIGVAACDALALSPSHVGC